MYGPWNMDRNRHSFFVIFGQISPFTPLTTWKIKIWKKKHTKRHHHFTLVYHKWQSYDLCFLRYGVRLTELFVNLGHFLPAYPSKSHKNENVQKLKTKKTKKTKKKTRRDIILLKCTKNHDHMLYFSWDMVRDGCNFYFHFVLFSCRFTAWKKKKNKIK